MPGEGVDHVDQCNPDEAWKILEEDQTAALIDVRTEPEWRFVGVPDLSSLGRRTVLAEWRAYPDMRVSEVFADQVFQQLGGHVPRQALFICRSGARSLEAAGAMSRLFTERGTPVRCVNVAEGFEGDLDTKRHRGTQNGWKARGLDWQQS